MLFLIDFLFRLSFINVKLPLTGSSFQLNSSSSAILMGALIFGTSRVSKSGTHSKKVLSGRWSFHGNLQPEETVMFNSTFP